MEQTKALNALEPYLALTKSAVAPRAAADLVTQATSNPNTYVFAELLQAPQIQALAQSAEYRAYLSLLEVFSYGTYASYSAAVKDGSLPQLNDAQTLKLRQLSLLTLASDPRNLSYASLQQALELPDARAVEDLVISAVYAGLVEAQLDPRNKTVHVSSVSPLRDLAPNAIPPILTALHTWSGRCTATLADLDAQIAAIRENARRRHDERAVWADTQAFLVDDFRQNELDPTGAHGRGQGRLVDAAVARLRGRNQNQNHHHHQQRTGKRGSNSLDSGHDSDEAMDLDEEDAEGEGGVNYAGPERGGKQRASRRRL
ncbi:hypothetical protein GGR54DRAFT_97252 [Hypoxylon sp. NC1633]|nr:hypothetical protein GGR54DRAFT_97252 [Hypoxylon sp. NC1633]